MEWYYLILLCIALLACANILSLSGRLLNDLSAWPLPLASIFILIVHAIVPSLKAKDQFYRYQGGYTDHGLIVSALHALLFLSILTVCAKILFPKSKEHSFILPTHLFVPLSVTMTIFMIGFCAMVYDVIAIGNMGGVGVYRQDRIGFSDDLGPYRMLATTSILAVGLMGRIIILDRNAIRVALFVFMVSSTTYYFYLINSRNSVFLMMMFLTYMMLISMKSRMIFNARSLGLLTLISTFALFGAFVIDQATKDRYSISSSAYAQTRLDNRFSYMLDGAFGNDEASIWMEDRYYYPAYGATYLAGLVSLVPRAIWAEKPTGGGPYLVNTITPGAYVVGARGQSSLTTGVLVEAKLNFSIFGLIIVPIAWMGILSLCLKRAFAPLSQREIDLWDVCRLFCWVTVAFFLSTSFIYSEFLGFFARTVLSILPLLIIGFLIRVLTREVEGG